MQERKMVEQSSSEINQVTRRRPRVILYLRAEDGPTPEDFANLTDGDVARLERRWGRPIFASEAALVASHYFLFLTPEKTIQQRKDQEAWQPGQEWTVTPG